MRLLMKRIIDIGLFYIVILITVTFIIAILTYYQFKKPSDKKEQTLFILRH